MEKESKKMLKYMLENPICEDGYCMLWDFYDAYCEETGYSEQRVMACMRYLESKGYIRYCQNQNGTDVGFELEHKAYQRRALQREVVLEFLIKSVVVPVFVSFATTIVLTHVWPMVKEPLYHLLKPILAILQ